jgi:hypothetical protein
MRKLLIRVALLLFIVLLVFLSPLFLRVTYADSCSSSPCKRYNQWSGGTTGGWEEITMYTTAPNCYTGCSWVHRGIWGKNNSDSDYVFVGVQKTQSSYEYLYLDYTPSSGLQFHFISSVASSDSRAYLLIYHETPYPQSGYDRVLLQSYDSSGTLNVRYQQNSVVTDSILDILQTGTRVSSGSAAATIPTYNTYDHQWRCGTCGDTWQYQTSDGTFLSQGNATYIAQRWLPGLSPHDTGSRGGTYEGKCSLPNCP